MAARPIRAQPETYEPDALGITAAYIIPVGMRFPETPEQVIQHVFDNILVVSTLFYVLQLFCDNARRSFPRVDTLPLQLIS
jgi:hypothetical protein